MNFIKVFFLSIEWKGREVYKYFKHALYCDVAEEGRFWLYSSATYGRTNVKAFL